MWTLKVYPPSFNQFKFDESLDDAIIACFQEFVLCDEIFCHGTNMLGC